ncbi:MULTISPECIES: alpha/beta fold hydrolase [unclassified Curtobacterium]|uniref:alpha/beta fold hydrolase n=1 Tax=unclassified Curtobacterium TaxID=257496 RepID=UPI000F4A35BF|nr:MULTISPECIES: alpha/beta hydrolase [unclassified Curtobacterium]MBF4587716.1 alpha/beta hydrolase [Curtobacterium sp. VKM Ac-2887]ROQ18685.1 pimeloyl-ACP methyl ester carboxylesterase [Curtobacterium sp. PhB171]ROQ18951.1 pimeloyl-ACP methyl ester carboxylesterase [Curtobacterium sp. PhB170]ROS32505.1 pimeloyl-ACP methyl ester carboxylesterase [Curtobacterium sp. PhB131]ROS74179.1 pimeloyl-ACP methyl ester carboxylesterase [Curtobacterium sp. PhB141]
MPPSTRVVTRGVEFSTRGSDAGVPVLVLHGSPGGIDVAELMGAFLPSEDFRVVTVSRPGYLGTWLDADHSTIDDEADQLAGVLDDLGIDRVGVLAWSGGAPAAYRLAVRHPERTRALAVASGVSGRWVPGSAGPAERLVTDTVFGAGLASAAARIAPAAAARAAVAGVSTLRGGALREHVAGVLADPVRRAFLLGLARTGNASGPRRAGWDNDVRQLAAVESLDLGAVRAPTLLVHGDADTEVVHDDSARAAETIPGAELVTVPGGTHFALWDHRDAAAVQAQVRAHLQQH